jgi:endonuclease-8
MLTRVNARTPYRANVYDRAGRPCPRCRTPITAETFGAHPRTAYWCPKCQPL